MQNASNDVPSTNASSPAQRGERHASSPETME
jgi:hypothetical protein